MEFATAYSGHIRDRFDQSIPDPITGEIQTSMTKQSFAEESEINNIMARYEKTGVIDHVKEHGGYVNFPDPLTYQDALQLTIEAKLSFDLLPAKVRREFDNDPFKFLAFVENPENVERMGELGLLEPIVEEETSEAEQPPAAADEPPTGADETSA